MSPRKYDKVTICVVDDEGLEPKFAGFANATVTETHVVRDIATGALLTELVCRGSRGVVEIVFVRDEGLTWARGWDTPEALALRAAVAL